ncbi:FliM/FliN family flagellar motor switch protein [Enterobacter sp. 22466]|uniref:FliM/FliN family flagellar motor switch protein n=1 Tax=Enterobacter sp. 22466 TaxID=3453924 RepID=UPI003F84469A
MTLREVLRSVSMEERALNALRSRLPGSWIEPVKVDEETRYLCLTLQDDAQRKATAFVSLPLWLEKHCEQLPGLAWRDVPVEYLVNLFRGSVSEWIVADDRWLVVNVELAEPLSQAFWVVVPASPLALAVMDWPAGTVSTPSNSITGSLRVMLRYVLGNSFLTLNQLATLEPGDVLVVEQSALRLMVNQHAIFHLYQTEPEVLIVGETMKNESTSEHEDDVQHQDVHFEMGDILLRVEFVLGRHEASLSELEGMTEGCFLPLPVDAEKQLTVCLNQQAVAKGELVTLRDGRLAVEIMQVHSRYHADTDS